MERVEIELEPQIKPPPVPTTTFATLTKLIPDIVVTPRASAPATMPVAAMRTSPATSPTDVTSFYFVYTFDRPGKRQWSKVTIDRWVEMYPDGEVTAFEETGRVQVDGCEGVVVKNTQKPEFEVFIPNKSCNLMWVRFRFAGGQWEYLGEMIDIN